MRTNVTPPMIKALLPRAPLAASTILTETTLELTCDAYTKAESDGRYLSNSNFAPLDARYFVRNPAVAEGNGLFHLVQEQFTPRFIRSLLFRPPLTGGAILGNGSVIEIEADCWSKAQSDGRYPLVATFNSLGSTVTSIDGRVSTLETDVGAIDGRVTALENSGGVAPTADLTVNSLTATTFVETPQLQSSAGDLQIQNALVTVRKEDGALLASFADGGISMDRDVTVAAASTLNATTADITQLTVGSTAATGAFSSNSSVTANPGGRQQSPARSAAGALRSDRPLALDRRGCAGRPGQRHAAGQRGHRPGGQPALPVPLRRHHRAGDEHEVRDRHGARGPWRLLRAGGHQPGAHGSGAPLPLHAEQRARGGQGRAGGAGQRRRAAQRPEPVHLAEHHQRHRQFGRGTQHRRKQQRRSDLRHGHLNASDRRLKTNIRRVPEQHVQRLFEAVEPQYYDRIGGGKDQLGFIAQDVQAAGKLGESLCKTMSGEEELLALDYQKLSVVLWGVVKSLQKRVEKLEKKPGRSN